MKLSVIIPALNEVLVLPRTLAAVRSACPDAQIIVADGGSCDGTQALCRSAGVMVVQTPRGRAVGSFFFLGAFLRASSWMRALDAVNEQMRHVERSCRKAGQYSRPK